VFLGAKLFARLGKSQLYGLSARGLAIDPVSDGGRGVPRFTEFWAREAGGNVEELTVYGAARLAARERRLPLRPAAGRETVLEVKARLYCARRSPSSASRRSPACSPSARTSARSRGLPPEVHDSDGFALHAGGASGCGGPRQSRRPLFSAFPHHQSRGASA